MFIIYLNKTMDPTNNEAKFADSFASAFAIDPRIATTSKASNNQLDDKDSMNYTTVEPILSPQRDSNITHYKYIENVDEYNKSGTSTVIHKYLPLLSIPEVALEKILSYLTFDQVAQMRVICRR